MVSSILAGLLVFLCLLAAAMDVRTRRIPNWLNLIVLLGGVSSLFMLPGWSAIWPHLAHFAIALVLGMALFAMRVWGGGDAKFYASLAMWFPLARAPLLAMAVALAGLVLVLAYGVWARKHGKASWKQDLPYGVAIAAGGIVLLAIDLSAASN